jgi:hypothetical protein
MQKKQNWKHKKSQSISLKWLWGWLLDHFHGIDGLSVKNKEQI